VDTPSGPLYHRYNDDGYGEHEDGSPFDGTGVGRAWPLLSGERGHHALLLGEDPLPYLETILRTAGPCGLLPEQAWDSPAIAARFLFPGRPTGSAMPLVWAHAEFLKLLVARERGAPCERLASLDARYGGERPEAATWHWRSDAPFAAMPRGRHLQIEAGGPFTLHIGVGGWQRVEDREAQPVGLGMYGVRLDAAWIETAATTGVLEINFTRRFDEVWEGADYLVVVDDPNHVQGGGV
jgi:glucoamylase